MPFPFPLTLSSIGILLVVLVTIGLLLWRLLLPRPLPGIPYHKPSANRFLGDAADLMKWQESHGDVYSFLAQRMFELNSPVVQIFMQPLGRPWVAISDPREIRDIKTRRFKEFDRSRFFGQVFKGILPDFHGSMPTNEQWHAHRRLINDTMSPAFLNNVAGPQMWTTMQSLISLWRQKARLAQGRPFSAQADIQKGALDIVWAATFGKETGALGVQTKYLANVDLIADFPDDDEDGEVIFPNIEEPEAFKSILTLTQSMDIPVSLPLLPRQLHWAALRVFPRLVAARKHKDQLIQEAINQAKRKAIEASAKKVDKDVKMKSAVELVIDKEHKAALKEGRPADCDSNRVKDELFGFLLAGHETGSTTVEWWSKLLTKHQDVQSKLRSVLREAFEQAAASNGQPSIKDITTTSIPYLDALMEEAHRVSLIAPLSVRLATKNTTILGHSIPAGTDVFLLHNGPGSMMKDIEVDESKRSKSSQAAKEAIPAWNKNDRADFVPERWLSTDTSTGEVCFNPQAGPAMPFGAGPRACFGEKWARLEVRIIIILILWNFELQALPEQFTSWEAVDGVSHRPKCCYVRLKAL